MRLPKKALPVLLLPALLTIQSCDEGSGPEASVGVPGMGDDQEVRVLSGPGRRDRSEAQGVNREVSTEGSV